ncbi:MAG TPA: hypothetical protein VGK29_14685 [Paludibaculum sp.]
MSQARRLVEAAIRRAASYGMVTEAGITVFLDTMLQLGVSFDDDPQYVFAARVLRDPGLSEAARARMLSAKVERHTAVVRGGDGELLLAAFDRFRRFPVLWDWEPEICYGEELSRALHDLYPRKCARLGPKRLDELVLLSASKAAAWGVNTASGQAGLAAMMLLGGAGVLEDPRFPFLLDAAELTSGVEPEKRITRLRAAMEKDIECRQGWQAEVAHGHR